MNNYFQIYHHSVLDVIRSKSVEPIAAVEMARQHGSVIQWFPCGSLQIDTSTAQRFEESGAAIYRQATADEDWSRVQTMPGGFLGRSLLGRGFWHSLRVFQHQAFICQFWGEGAWKLRDSTMTIGDVRRPTTAFPEFCFGEPPLEAFMVTLEFKRNLTRKVVARVIDSLRAWLAQNKDNGIGGEGPVTAIQRAFPIRKRCLQVFFDASRTGQFTLNSLVLKMIDLMPEVLTQGIYFTEGIAMGPRPLHVVPFDEYFGPILWETGL